MSGHRRVKDIAYDDEELDDFDDDDYEEAEEDKEQMRRSKIKVREALGSDLLISDKEIEDALWHYYYDVAKSVSYLKNKKIPAVPKKPKAKQPTRFDEVVNSASVSSNGSFPFTMPTLPTYYPTSAAEFFEDTPWGRTPPHRLGNITVEPRFPQGGLLGGSSGSKPSKLAALAAARKKENEGKKPGSSGSSSRIQQTDKAVSLLDRLNNKKDNNIDTTLSKRPVSSTTPEDPTTKPHTGRLRAYPVRHKSSPKPTLPKAAPEPEARTPSPTTKQPDLRASPSSFAAIILGSAGGPSWAQHGPAAGSVFLSPYTNEPDFAKQDPFAGPSPDDVIKNAQSKGAKGGKPQSKPANDKNASEITSGVAAVTVDDAPRIKSKNLNVAEEFHKSGRKSSANFVVIGHVDHGKSTLMGRLLYDLKVVNQRSVDKLRKEATNIGKSSFALAWVMDQTSEERERGVTVDIASNSFETARTHFTILDAPGHRDFIPNMIAGAAQADFAVLVIDAGANAFESGLRGQTREHALLVRSMGVTRLVVAVNKMDAVGWSRDRFDEVRQQTAAFLAAAGFAPRNVAFVPCAGLTGDNVTRPPPAGTAPWLADDAPTLLAELETSEPARHALDGPLRLTIADVFRGGITNPLSVAGRLESGSVQVGDAVVAAPSGETAVVRGIETDGADPDPAAAVSGTGTADWAVAGQIATLHLTDIDAVHLRLGDVLCAPAAPVPCATRLVVKILAFEHVLPGFVDVHRGRLFTEGRVARLVAVLDKNSGAVVKKKPRIVKPGEVARVEVVLEKALPLEAPGRIVLRAEGQTVAAGMLEKVE